MRITTQVLASVVVTSCLVAQPALNKIADSATQSLTLLGNSGHHLAMDTAGNIYTIFNQAGIRLVRSRDDGRTWSRVPSGAVGTTNNTLRSGVAAGPDCALLHVAWGARHGQVYSSIFYRVFDTVGDKWTSGFSEVLTGVSATNKWNFTDIVVTPKGTVAIFVQSTGIVNPGLKKWAGYMMIKKAGQTTFTRPVLVNPNFGASRVNALAVGETVHIVSRHGYKATTTGGSTHHLGYRAYNTATSSFTSPGVRIGGVAVGDQELSNGTRIAADDSGNLYAAYGVGGVSPVSTGEIKVAFAKPPYTTWSRLLVTKDPKIMARQVNHHFALVRTAGSQVFMCYSKRSEDYKNLYSQELKDGAFVGAEKTLITSTTKKYEIVVGHQSHSSRIGLNAIVQDNSFLRTLYLLDGTKDVIYGRSGQIRFVGHACSGKLAKSPRLGVDIPPTIARALKVLIDDAPASSNGLIAIGLKCEPTPIDLKIIGADGCALFQDLLLTVGFTTSATGSFTLPVAVVPAFTAPVFVQSAVAAPGANSAGTLFTRSMSIHL